MKRTHITVAAALTGLLVLSAPAAAERIRLVNITGYSVIDEEHLVLNGGPNHHHLVTMRNRCAGLRHGVEVGLSFPSTTTLYTPFLEYVSTREDSRCAIDTIEAVESVDAARALIEQRAAEEAAAGSDTSAPIR
ncbi:DUF6491 family protein [Maricaulis salignorans]|uniref:DUF6491 family protein n=1 Tax=Maricaulis salignorans TaxID=144026 RepID=UPI003A8ECB40